MPELFHRKIERSAIGFVLAIIAAASVGGLVEIAPLFTIDETVESAPDMRLYTPLELAGRNIYVREGCYDSAVHCSHAQDRGDGCGPVLRAAIDIKFLIYHRQSILVGYRKALEGWRKVGSPLICRHAKQFNRDQEDRWTSSKADHRMRS